MAGRTVLQANQAASANQTLPGQQRERGKDAGVVRGGHLLADCDREKRTPTGNLDVHMCTDLVGVRF